MEIFLHLKGAWRSSYILCKSLPKLILSHNVNLHIENEERFCLLNENFFNLHAKNAQFWNFSCNLMPTLSWSSKFLLLMSLCWQQRRHSGNFQWSLFIIFLELSKLSQLFTSFVSTCSEILIGELFWLAASLKDEKNKWNKTIDYLIMKNM